MLLKSFLKRRNSKRPISLLFINDKDEIESIWYEGEELNNIEEKYLQMEVMDYCREDDCTEIWLR